MSLLWILIGACLGYIATSFLGYVFHYLFHQPYFGKFYEIHKAHHLLYPPNDFYSEKYRKVLGGDTSLLFGIVFSPFILIVILLSVFGIFNVLATISALIAAIIAGWLNDFMHSQYHLFDAVIKLDKFKYFRYLKEKHLIHHQFPNKNYGIYSFLFDKVFGTYL
jgi:sterol desaturase/sphingolipid hydroxylase (fatty acid hydroxylase superfamily)